MFGISTTELLIIMLVALIVLGPTKLPGIARSLGKALGEFRRMTTDVQRTLNLEAARIEEDEKQKAKATQKSGSPDTSPDKPAAKPTEKPPEKPTEKPTEKPADMPTEKPTEKPADMPLPDVEPQAPYTTQRTAESTPAAAVLQITPTTKEKA